jgi:hypothetical protein
MVDALDLKFSSFRSIGSSPVAGIFRLDNYNSPKDISVIFPKNILILWRRKNSCFSKGGFWGDRLVYDIRLVIY